MIFLGFKHCNGYKGKIKSCCKVKKEIYPYGLNKLIHVKVQNIVNDIAMSKCLFPLLLPPKIEL